MRGEARRGSRGVGKIMQEAVVGVAVVAVLDVHQESVGGGHQGSGFRVDLHYSPLVCQESQLLQPTDRSHTTTCLASFVALMLRRSISPAL